MDKLGQEKHLQWMVFKALQWKICSKGASIIGKTIQEIALSRELKATTICSHLAGFIEQGELKLNEILSSSITEKLETTMRDFPADNKLGEALSALSNQFAADEIVLGFAWKKYNSKNDSSS